MKKIYTTEEIEAYLRGQMTEEAQNALKAQMETDAELADEVQFYSSLMKANANVAEKDFASIVAKVDAKLQDRDFFSKSNEAQQPAKVRQLRPMRLVWAAAASLLILIVAGLWWSKANYSNNALQAGNYQEADMPGTMGTTSDAPIQYQEGLSEYANQNYEAALSAFAKAAEADSLRLASTYFIGHCNYQLKRYPEAIEQFNTVIAAKDETLPAFINTDKLSWNCLQAYLASNQLDDNFFRLLNDLAENGGSPYRQKAQELQRKLDSFWRRLSF